LALYAPRESWNVDFVNRRNRGNAGKRLESASLNAQAGLMLIEILR
jgi:hypothetical protein